MVLPPNLAVILTYTVAAFDDVSQVSEDDYFLLLPDFFREII
ncbi:hypothetical protein [Nostoc sp.]